MTRAVIQADFWHDQLEVNASQAIFHQWQQLEASGCINNFRIAAGITAGLREGWFFADSDAYKWLDAAARIWANQSLAASLATGSLLRSAACSTSSAGRSFRNGEGWHGVI